MNNLLNVLIIGSGGREHALAWKIKQSKLLDQLFITPGNGGTQSIGTNVNIAPTDFEQLKKFSLDHRIDLVVIGPEQPLVEGITDSFRDDLETNDIPVLGPCQLASMLEGSKDFANRFMEKYDIPTAKFKTFSPDTLEQGIEYLEQINAPYVLKSDGLAGGKGVIITEKLNEAKGHLKSLLQGQFGEASKKVVVEEFLDGVELSVFVLTDMKSYKILPSAKDYKRIGEGNTGLNTGGMGAASPAPNADADFMKKVEEKIIKPTIEGISKEPFIYQGFLYFGLIRVGDEPYVIEYNVRMGDPETQIVLPRIKSDLLALLYATSQGDLHKSSLEIDPNVSGCVVLASKGYPEKYEKGKAIRIGKLSNVDLFHAGTAEDEGKLITSGGRVLALSARGDTYENVFQNIYRNIDQVTFEGKYYRQDIGFDL